ncbi:MAG: NAD-dependent epimerase/dehydratase family protein, partial [Chloroflexi bacterium]|nr:NAD-dependent epimerase/dehydratase family protein [Chloroflexota bacterium]
MTSPVLITGGAGSVGRQLIARLREAGRPVRVFDLPFMDFSGLEDDDGIDIVKGDITNADDVAKGVEGVSAVVHLAALLPPNSERDRERTFAVNVGGTESIVKALESI